MNTPETAQMALTLTLFGPMQVLVQGQPLPRLRSHKALWLLALLVLRHERPVEREWLAGTLWPDAYPEQSLSSLRSILSELRKALGVEAERLQSPTRHTLLISLGSAVVDVLTFDTAIARNTLPALEEAADLYQGPLLEGCAEEWVGQERNAREADCLRALMTLAEDAQSRGSNGKAADYFRRALALDPFRDGTRRGLMEALAYLGDVNAALQVYRDFVQLLRDDPRAAPDAQTYALYERLRRQARRQALPTTPVPPGQASAETPIVSGHLPHPLTDFIGREDERIEVAASLRRSRLVTLTGPGGIGKTRLAREVAAEAGRSFPDGAWLIALEALADGTLVAQQIAGVLGFRQETARSALHSLTEQLRTKRLLLVLDNCEHLLEASANVAGHLLRECAGMRVLATSREALGITGETVWSVPPLPVPDPDRLPAGAAMLKAVMMDYEGIRLFVERAKAAHKTFELTAENALSVAQVCARLDGMPLALELAAARVRAITVGQMAMRLDDYLEFLTGGNRAAPSRQQTLRATLDWSYALLTVQEQFLLGRLSVFSGGWDLKAAEGVCRGGGISERHILDLLTSLADKSLLNFEDWDQVADGRYRLLEMVQQYAAERLEARGEAKQVRDRHRDWFLVLAEEAEPQLKGPQQGPWLRRLEAEIDNLRSALAWCRSEDNGAEPGLRMVGALWQFWELRGYYNEGRAALAEALSRQGAAGQTNERAKALYAAGVFAFYQGDYSAALALQEESLAIFQDLGNKKGIAGALKDLGRVCGAQGNYEEARIMYEKSLAISRETGDRLGTGWALNDLGNLAGAQGEYGTAKALHQESLTISRELRDIEGIAWSLHHLGGVTNALGDYTAAIAVHAESLTAFREMENKQGAAWALNYLGNAMGEQGDYRNAKIQFEEALSTFRELGNKQGIAWSLNDLGKVVGAQGDLREARALYSECISLHKELGDRRGISAGLRRVAALMPEATETATRLWAAADALRESIGARLPPREQELYDRQVSAARRQMSDEAFNTQWAAGQALTGEQATAYVLDALDEQSVWQTIPMPRSSSLAAAR